MEHARYQVAVIAIEEQSGIVGSSVEFLQQLTAGVLTTTTANTFEKRKPLTTESYCMLCDVFVSSLLQEILI